MDTYKAVDFNPREIHLFSRIHELVAYYNLINIPIYIIIGVPIIEIFHGVFFNFGPPFDISTFTLNSDVSWMFFIFFAMILQLMSTVSEELDLIVSVYGNHSEDTYYMDLFSTVVGIVMKWTTLAWKLVVMRSQISIIAPVILIDIMVFYLAKERAIVLRLADKSANSMFYLNTSSPSGLSRTYAWFMLLQLCLLPIMLAAYIVTGLTTSDLFSASAPVEIMGHMVTSNAVFAIILLVVFIDQMAYGFVRGVIDQWVVRQLQNPDTTHQQLLMNRTIVIFVCVTKRALNWVRLMFSLSFLTTRYLFVIVYIAGDMISHVWVFHKKWTYRRNRQDAALTENTARLVFVGVVFMLTEIVIVAEFLTITNYVPSTYFVWASEIVIFGNVIKSNRQIIMLMVLSALSQVGSTMENDIVWPDFYNWLYGKTSSEFLDVYTSKEKLSIMVISRINYWFRFVLLLQFVLSNCYFVVASGSVDLIIGSIILGLYVAHKDHKDQAAEMANRISELGKWMLSNKENQ